MNKRFVAFVCTVLCVSAQPAFATFSIIARDPSNGEMGIAVASKFLATRANGSGAEAGVGVVARQADNNNVLGRRAFELLRAGRSAEEVLQQLLKEQTNETHQVAIIDGKGNVAASTGAKAYDWKGHRVGKGYSVQGNILVGPQVLDAMANAFESASGTLAERLILALEAGDKVGGDKRGRQSAYLLIVKGTKQREGVEFVHDLAVDDHFNPIPELRRLLDLSRSRALSLESLAAYQRSDLTAALQLAEAAANLAPFVTERMWVGVLRYFAGDHIGALAELRAARAVSPEQFDVEWAMYDVSNMIKDAGFLAKVKAK